MPYVFSHCSINELNAIILLSNIYIFIKCLHINEAYTKLMQETLNLKKEVSINEDQAKNLHMATQ